MREGGLLSDFLSWKEIEEAVAASKLEKVELESENSSGNSTNNSMDLAEP